MIRRWPLVVLIVAALGTTAAPTARRGPPPRFPASDPGLTTETVTTTYQDRAGFLWIGSRAGLILFDGYASTVFEHDVAEAGSLADNAIRTVFEDSRRFLWIGTNAGGLDRLDRSTWVFDHHRHASSDPGSLSHDSVYAIAEDRDGLLWVGTQGGLNRLDPSSGRFERFPAGADGPGSDYVAALHFGRDGALWIGTVGGGLARRDPATGRFTKFRHDRAEPGSISSDSVFAIAEDDRGRLWLATAAGVCRMQPGGVAFDRFPLADAGRAGDSLATGVVVDGDQGVWASSLEFGLWRFDPAAERFERHPFLPGIAGGATDRIISLNADRQGNLWVGTWGSGLGRVSPGSRTIGTLAMDAPPGDAPDPDISAVMEDSQGRVWLGDARGGLWRIADGHLARAVAVPGTPLSLCEDRDGGLWVGSTAGLSRLDPGRGTLEPAASASGNTLGPGWVWALHVDRRGTLWVGTGEGGLNRRRDDGSFERFQHDPADENSLSDNYVTAILEDRRGTLWIGTRSGGLNRLEPVGGRWTRYGPEPNDDRSLSHRSVTALLEGPDGSIWIGTGGGGINRLEQDPGMGRVAFARFAEKDGLIDDNVVSLAGDSDGTLWIGTRRGLSRLDAERRAFANFGTEDGMPSVDLHVGAAAAGRTRNYFGTHRGVVVVRRGTPMVVPRASPTVLASMSTPSGAIDSERPPWEASEVEMPFGQVLSLEFATLDYGDRRRHRYAYRLDPVSDEWIDLGSRRDITFTTLDPGTFTLRARGRNDQGVWSEIGRPLTIRVVPPFWMTLWFRLLVAGGVAGSAIAVHLVRTSSLERRNRALLELKEQRERALDESRTSQQALAEAYRRLRGLAGRLEAAKEEERRWIARELHDEMGTGLTTAKLVVQLLADAPSTEERDKRIGEAIGLLDRMIGHVRALSLDLRPPLLDELGLGAALRGYADTLARRARIEIALETDGLPVRLREDLGIAAFRIAQEALTNVIRHADARRVTVEVRYDRDWLEVRVADDGRGFDVEVAMEGAAGGHAGLLGMKERVESMGGELRIRAGAGQGTEILARLPAGT